MNEWHESAYWTWVYDETDDNKDSTVLHAPDGLEVNDWHGTGRTLCGVTSEHWAIPGLLTRIVADGPYRVARCVGCSTVKGYPQGSGSPKNDAACRAAMAEPSPERYGNDRKPLPRREA